MSVNMEDLTRENMVFELSDIGKKFLKHKDASKIINLGSSAFIGALYLKDDREGMFSDRAISLTLLDDNEDYVLYMDAGLKSIKIDKKDYDEETLAKLCFDYRYYI